MVVPAKELDRYFFFSSANLVSSPISKHLKAVHEHFSTIFLTNSVASTQLQKSFLKVAKSTDASVAPEVKEACQQLVIKLEILAFNYKVYEECRSSCLNGLNWLSNLRA